jgi:tRNA pseudouridine65 synthase
MPTATVATSTSRAMSEQSETPRPLEVLYRDERFIAIDKPAGMLVHRTWISNGSEFALQRLRDQIGRRVYPLHRLDRPTSGVLLFALDPEAAAEMGAAFEGRRLEKRYLAVTRGFVEAEGVIDYALREEPDKPAQEAVTRYRPLARVELPIPVGRYATARYSLVEAIPETGRMHQLRKHFAHIFHPIIGDTTHGEGRHNRLFRERFGLNRLLLLAHQLSFRHPYSGADISIRAPLPPPLRGLFEEFGWPQPD